MNVKANRIIYNDKCEALVNIFNNLDNDFVAEVENTIKEWKLSKLGKQEYIDFRSYYNKHFMEMTSREKAIAIYCLLTHSFNYQLAFNSKGEYNMPSGYNRSWFSPQLKEKLIAYIDRIGKIDIEFNNSDFHNINLDAIGKNCFFYADPPYLITVGAYERDYFCKWSEDYERELYNTLDILNQKGCKFALSNVMEHKGKTNTILKEWSDNYNVYHLNKEYANCNYQTNDREIKTSDEVLITNY